MSNNDPHPINLPQLKQLIHDGLEAIPVDQENKDAVIVIGDTGVGKSTILNFLAGAQLVVKYDQLKPYLDSSNATKIKIGHLKYSQTSVPTKCVIQGIAFYDCPGFKDNKGEEYEISNSFFVQRLLDLYQNVKLVLIVDESHISEARADKLPKLIKNLHRSFKNFDDIKEGVCIIINRAAPDHTVEKYNKQIRNMTKLKNQFGTLFEQKERDFLDFLMFKQRVLLFKQAGKNNSPSFQAGQNQSSIINCIKSMSYVKSRHIENILSEGAKLAIRDFIDQITQRSNNKIQIICAEIVDIYSIKVQNLGRDINGIMKLKETVTKLAEEIMAAKKENIIEILQREMSQGKMQDFQEDFASIMFFKGIYDKTGVYFSNLTNKIYAELSHLLTKLDKRITGIQREEQEEKQREVEREEVKVREVQREKEKVLAIEHCGKMDDLKVVAQNLVAGKKNLIEEIKAAMRALGSVEEQLRKVKVDAVSLKKLSKEIDNEFERIDTTFFQRRVR